MRLMISVVVAIILTIFSITFLWAFLPEGVDHPVWRHIGICLFILFGASCSVVGGMHLKEIPDLGLVYLICGAMLSSIAYIIVMPYEQISMFFHYANHNTIISNSLIFTAVFCFLGWQIENLPTSNNDFAQS